MQGIVDSQLFDYCFPLSLFLTWDIDPAISSQDPYTAIYFNLSSLGVYADLMQTRVRTNHTS